MQTQIIYLDLVPGGIPPVAQVSQGDTAARKLYFRILNNGELFDTSGLSATIRGKKPDGAMFSYACDVYQYSVQRSCTEQMTAVAGQTVCEIQLLDGEGVVGTANFILNVEPDPIAGATASSSEFTQFQALANAAEASAVRAASNAGAAASSAAAAAESATSVANAFRYNAVTTPGTDLNDYNRTGYYYFSSSYTPANAPAGSLSGLLFVSALAPTFTSNDYLKQIWFRQGPGYSWQMWTRTKGGTAGSTTWGEWYQFLTPMDITGGISEIVQNNLEAGKALASNGYGKIVTANPTLAELNYLSGVTANVQGQIDTAKGMATNAALAAEAAKVQLGMLIGNGGQSSLSVPHGTFTPAAAITMTTGLWLVIFTGRWINQGSRGGVRQLIMTDTEGSSTAIDFAKTSSIPASIENSTVQQITAIFNVTEASRTIYITAFQDCGVSTTLYPRYSSVRLGDPRT